MAVERDGGDSATVKAEESLANENGAVHNARNPGATPTRILTTYVVEKGKPLAEAVR
jgi:mannose-6-phosphate isomerase-like protein (cupin superfamily)